MIRREQSRIAWNALVCSDVRMGYFEAVAFEKDVVKRLSWVWIRMLGLKTGSKSPLGLLAMNHLVGRLKAHFFHQAI